MPLASARQRPEKLFVGRAGNFLPAAPLERRTENASRQLGNRERNRLFSIALSGLGSLPWASWWSRSSTGTDTKHERNSFSLALAAGRVFVFLLVLAGACQIGTTYDASGFVTEPIHASVQLLLQGNGAGGAGPGWSSRSEEGNNEGRETKGIRKRARVRSELDSAAKEPQIRRRQPEATRKGNEEERTTRSHEYNKQ